MAKTSKSSTSKSKRKASSNPKGNETAKRTKRAEVGTLSVDDRARRDALVTLGKASLHPYYVYLHGEKLINPLAPTPDEVATSWNAMLVASICAISESLSPSLDELRKGLFVPSPPEPESPVLVRTRARSPVTPVKPPSKEAGGASAKGTPKAGAGAGGNAGKDGNEGGGTTDGGGGDTDTTPDPDVAALQELLALEQAKNASLIAVESDLAAEKAKVAAEKAKVAELQAKLDANGGNVLGLPQGLTTPPPHIPTPSPGSSALEAQLLAKGTQLPPHLRDIWFALRASTRQKYHTSQYVPLALFRAKSFVESLANGEKVVFQTDEHGTIKCVPNGRHTALADHEFLPTLKRVHQLDAFLRTARITANTKDLMLVERVIEATDARTAYNWFEQESSLAHRIAPYQGVSEPSAEVWTRWHSAKAKQLATLLSLRPSQPPPDKGKAGKGLASRTPGPDIPLALRQKARERGVCLKFNKGYCTESGTHSALLTVDGKKVSVSLTHTCLSCDSANHPFASCPQISPSP